MPSNTGNQLCTVKYYDPVDSEIANRIGKGVRKTGIYSGGYITRVTDTSVTVSALECEIASADGSNNQVSIKTGVGGSGVITVTGLGAFTPYVVIKWTATTDPDTDYMEIVAESAINVLANPYWLIVGKCSFPGGVLTPNYGWDSTDKITTRSNPNVQDLFLKVEPTSPASMYVRIRGGRISYGTSNFDIADQLSPLLLVPPSNSWVVAIQVNTSGAIVATYGSAAASPSAPSYGGLLTLAEITIASGASTVISSNIKDTRSFMGNGNAPSTAWANITGSPVAYKSRSLLWYSGYPAVGTAVGLQFTMPFAGTFTKAWLKVVSAPTGANLIVDVNKNGTTIATSSKPTIVAGATSGSSETFTTTTFAIGDVITMDIDQVGSTVAGAGLSIQLDVTITT
jgi:hypothetical protein